MSYLERKRNAIMSVTNTVRGYLRTTSGEPPLTLTNTYPDKMKVKLYGKSTQASGTYYTANHTVTATECNYTTRKLWFPPSSSGYVGDFYVFDGFAYWCFTLNYDCDTASSEYYIDCLREGIYEVDYNNIETQRVTVTQSSTAPSGYTDFSSYITSRTGNIHISTGTQRSLGTVNGNYANFTLPETIMSGTVLSYDSYTPSLKYVRKRIVFDVSYDGYTGNFYIQDGSSYFLFTLNNDFTSNMYVYYLDTIDGKIYYALWEHWEEQEGYGGVLLYETNRVSTLPTGVNAPTDFFANVYETTSTEESITITTSTTASYTVLSAENVTSKTYPDTVHPQTIASPTAGATVRGKNLLQRSLTGTVPTGITQTPTDNGGINIVGTISDSSYFACTVGVASLAAGTYTITTNCIVGTSTLYFVIYEYGTTNLLTTVFITSRKFTVTQAMTVIIRPYMTNGNSVNITAYIQIEEGSTATAYEPYQTPADIVVTDTNGQPVKLYGLPVTSDGNVTIGGQQYLSDVLTDNGDTAGIVTRNIDKKVFNGAETFVYNYSTAEIAVMTAPINSLASSRNCSCSHGSGVFAESSRFVSITADFSSAMFHVPFSVLAGVTSSSGSTAIKAAVIAWFTAQYATGTPVTVLYVRATPTTENVTITKNKAMNGTTIITSDCPYVGAEYYSWEA